MIATRRTIGIAAACAVALIVSGCTSSSGTDDPSTTASPPAGVSTPAATASNATPSPSAATPSVRASRLPSAKQIYVSIGDSYAAGYQPKPGGPGSTTRNGFAYQVVTAAKAKGYDYTLVNFGCGGATTTSVLESVGCAARNLGPGAPHYDDETQAAAAEDFLRANRGKVGLITVSLGGNDVTACANGGDVTTCLTNALTTVRTNLAKLLRGLRKAAGPGARIIGTTYPDVFLGAALSSSPDQKSLANLSVLAFKTFINPALQSSYDLVGGGFVDVTTATGAYGPMTDTTTLAPYGTIPVPVAKICKYTYYCDLHDIHPRTNGYRIIADLIVGELPKY